MAIKYNSNSKNAQIEALKRALDFTAEQLFTYINNVNATNNIFVWDGKPEITNSNLAFYNRKIQMYTITNSNVHFSAKKTSPQSP